MAPSTGPGAGRRRQAAGETSGRARRRSRRRAASRSDGGRPRLGRRRRIHHLAEAGERQCHVDPADRRGRCRRDARRGRAGGRPPASSGTPPRTKQRRRSRRPRWVTTPMRWPGFPAGRSARRARSPRRRGWRRPRAAARRARRCRRRTTASRTGLAARCEPSRLATMHTPTHGRAPTGGGAGPADGRRRDNVPGGSGRQRGALRIMVATGTACERGLPTRCAPEIHRVVAPISTQAGLSTVCSRAGCGAGTRNGSPIPRGGGRGTHPGPALPAPPRRVPAAGIGC